MIANSGRALTEVATTGSETPSLTVGSGTATPEGIRSGRIVVSARLGV